MIERDLHHHRPSMSDMPDPSAWDACVRSGVELGIVLPGGYPSGAGPLAVVLLLCLQVAVVATRKAGGYRVVAAIYG